MDSTERHDSRSECMNCGRWRESARWQVYVPGRAHDTLEVCRRCADEIVATVPGAEILGESR